MIGAGGQPRAVAHGPSETGFEGSADAAAAVETLRRRRVHLQEVVSAQCEGGGSEPCATLPRCDGYRAIDDVLEALAAVEEQLAAALAGAEHERGALAQVAAELHDAAERHAATLCAVRDGVVEVDRDGVIRMLTPAAAAALGIRRDDALGRRLRDLPALAALVDALGGESHDVTVVALPRGDVLVRVQPYEGGVVATLHELAAEKGTGHRSTASVARYTFDDLVGEDPEFLRVLDDARRAARTDAPILICGESGTGKELLAQAIHSSSARASEPFLGVNVTAIPRELLESELFGYEGGAFTGARPGGRSGKFELAGRGTLLLDELAEMPLDMQSKLLRVLQERLVARLGSSREIAVRARMIATSGRDLEEAVRLGRFRLDLFHRVCVVVLRLPPLRARPDDVPLIVEHHLRARVAREHRHVRVAPHVMAALRAHDWPGNVRQLLNVIDGEVSVLPPGADELTRIPVALLQRPRHAAPAREARDLPTLDELERRGCEEALAAFGGNVARAARALGIAKGTLYSKMRRYGLGGPEPALGGAGAVVDASAHVTSAPGAGGAGSWGVADRPHAPNRALPVAVRKRVE